MPGNPLDPPPKPFVAEPPPQKTLGKIENRSYLGPRNFPNPSEHNFIEYAYDEKKYLFQPSCAAAEAYASDIKIWMQSRGETCSYSKPVPQEMFSNMENWCYTDVTECLPKSILSFYGHQNQIKGPNCYNAALMMAGIVPGLRYVSDGEIEATLNSPLCQSVKGAALPGDIGIIFSKDLDTNKIEYSHAYLQVSERIAFSKNGLGNAPYILTPQKSMQDRYSVGKNLECPNDEGKEPPSRRKCDNFTSHFRCQTFEDYFQSNNLPKGLQSIFDSLNSIEGCLSEFSKGKLQVLSVSAQKNIMDSVSAITQYLEENKGKLNAQEQSFANIFKLRVFSYFDHFMHHGTGQFGGGVVYSDEQVVFMKAMKKELDSLDPERLKDLNNLEIFK